MHYPVGHPVLPHKPNDIIAAGAHMWCMPCRPSFPPCRAAFLPNLPCLLPAHLPAHPACLLPWLLQTERISALEAQRSQLLQQLPSGVQAHVLKRQHEAVEEEGGGAGVVLCRSA